MKTLLRLATAVLGVSAVAGFDIVRDYSGQNFFSGWDFYGGWDNLTLGDVWWLDQSNATTQGLAYVNSEGNAIIKVDNTTNVPLGQKRNSIRITSQDVYDLGSLWIIDVNHIPYGCSVWPAFWTFGPNWPQDGEIDIIEAINVMGNNQMAIHTTSGCTHGSQNQLGTTIGTDCSLPAGCVVAETSPNSYNSGFAAAGGGVWATQFDATGIYIWFWSRPNVPTSIAQANATSSVDISQWGTPHASYLADTCNITQYFSPQNLVIDITLCGDWAGTQWNYNASCGNSGPTGLCYNDCVVGPGSPRYDEAYFDISYIRAYTTGVATSSSTATATSAGASSSPIGITAPPSGSNSQGSSGASRLKSDSRTEWGILISILSMVIGALSIS
ncbi:glycoside hydrolase family 16 protein [Leucogyrophana mollusca]|uniref:Glycoside hydrolase family 16 protein n=1 Tax=Leucogyrophana mollusca TaxID=85980 RepID=A0ACB8BHC7_9AGAM|nr:glycoside hydrolase family 16 protein [Leucogyrophana mollusca]